MTATFQRAAWVSGCRDDSIVTQACVRPNACYRMNLRQCRQIVRVCVRSVSSPLAVVWEGVPIRTEISLIRAVKPCSCSPCELSVNWAWFACTVALSFLCKCPLGPAWKLMCVYWCQCGQYMRQCVCSITLLLLFLLYLRAWEVFVF